MTAEATTIPERPSLETPSAYPIAEGRDVAAILDPCPLTIIGSRDAEGRTGFATVIWAMPVSHFPAMTAFALRPKSHTMGIIKSSGYFSLSTLPSDTESVRIVEDCGGKTGHKTDKGLLVEHELIAACGNVETESTEEAESQPTGEAESEPALLPVPTHALSWEICEVESIQEAGDHLLVVGRVIKAASKASRDEKGRLAPIEMLLCIQHDAYAPVGETI